MKALFQPMSILAGLLAAMISKKLFALVWRLIDDDRDAPNPKQRVEDHRKLAAALVLQGAISGAVRGGVDHATRHGFAHFTGAWPGEEPQSK